MKLLSTNRSRPKLREEEKPAKRLLHQTQTPPLSLSLRLLYRSKHSARFIFYLALVVDLDLVDSRTIGTLFSLQRVIVDLFEAYCEARQRTRLYENEYVAYTMSM